jgi:oligoribonuclease NrnB/cAMP/cGMP phosphodiesterase (DHH superfamily)
MSTEQREYMNPGEIDVVIFHKNCNDGKAAAACAMKYLGGTRIKYIPLNYGNEVDTDALVGKNIILLDFSFKKPELENIRKIAKKVMILDHHESAMQDLKDTEGCFFDMNESGASLAWEYFFPGKTVPKFIEYIKDRDLWTYHCRAESEPMFYGLTVSGERTIDSWIKYIDNENLVYDLITLGKAEMLKNHLYIINVTKCAESVKIDVDKTIYNIKYLELESPKLVSEISEKLYTDNDIDFTVCWYRDKFNTVPKYLEYYSDNYIVNWYYGKQKYYVSLRTNKENIDLGKIAGKIANGGGHKKAAGFNINCHPNKIILY